MAELTLVLARGARPRPPATPHSHAEILLGLLDVALDLRGDVEP